MNGLKFILAIFLPLMHKKDKKEKEEASPFWHTYIVDGVSVLIKNGREYCVLLLLLKTEIELQLLSIPLFLLQSSQSNLHLHKISVV